MREKKSKNIIQDLFGNSLILILGRNFSKIIMFFKDKPQKRQSVNKLKFSFFIENIKTSSERKL